MPTVLCISNELIYGYVAGIHFCLLAKEVSRHTSPDIYHNPLEFYEYRLILLYTKNFTIYMPLILNLY